MAYIGKEFTYQKEENYEEFINTLAKGETSALRYLSFKPNYILNKSGDEYTLVIKTPDFNKEISFKPGVPFNEELAGGALKAKTVFNVDGDTFTQIQDFGDKGSITMKREFSADLLKVTVSASKFDLTATRYYVPA